MSDQQQKLSLLDRVRHHIRLKHYSIRTEEAYVQAVKRFILIHDKRHPSEMGADEIRQYLSHLATEGRVSASTQNQALAALLFLYWEVLGQTVEWVDDVDRAKRPKRLPVVFTGEGARAVLCRLRGDAWLMASLLYGSGQRLLECVRLRVKDVDFARLQVTVRGGKGDRDRVTMLPPSLAEPQHRQLERVKVLHEADVREGFGRVHLPCALARKCAGADRDRCWQYVFPASRRSVDPRTGREQRHHIA